MLNPRRTPIGKLGDKHPDNLPVGSKVDARDHVARFTGVGATRSTRAPALRVHTMGRQNREHHAGLAHASGGRDGAMSDDESGKPGKLETAVVEFTNDGQPRVRARKMKPRDVDVTLMLDSWLCRRRDGRGHVRHDPLA